MRKSKCAECGHEFEVPHGTGEPGRDLKCPECGGTIHRREVGGPGPECGPPRRGASRGRRQRVGQRRGRN